MVRGSKLKKKPVEITSFKILTNIYSFEPADDCGFTGVTNKEAIREDYEKYRGETQSRNESVFNALSGLKRIVLGSVFERHFEAATAEDAETDWERLSAYKNEAVYVRSRQQSVRVIYQIQVLQKLHASLQVKVPYT